MRIERIVACSDHITVVSDVPFPASAVGLASVPLTRGETGRHTPSRVLYETTKTSGKELIFPRYADGYDLLVARFRVSADGDELDGVCYVTDVDASASSGCDPRPPVGKPVGTWVTCPGEDMDHLGLGGMMTEINMAWIMTLTPTEEDIPHSWNGKTYRFAKSIMDTYDRLMRPCIQRGVPCLVRLINRFSYRLKGSDEALRKVIGHPAYEDTGFCEQMSAFNITNEEGLDHFCACVDFLCSRYADPASPLFCSAVMDVGNEINAQAVWHNCGPMTCSAYMEEYTQQLRLAHLIGRKYNAAHRVDVSFDHHFAIPYRPDPLRYYSAKECLFTLADLTRRDGDFPWGISAHPYPENLSKPDFYHDETATFDLDTPRITMKNVEVWQALAAHPDLIYRGLPRRVIFDEQGFHTDYNDPESENKGAYAFVLLWQKLKHCPSVEQFLINRYTDMPEGDEGGLHLGLRYERGYADAEHLFINPGPYKRICAAIRAMGTEEEARWTAEARVYVGEALFDSLLAPSVAVQGCVLPSDDS
ncbi:MAG: hypothetical protein IKU90_03290 [Clostridia bacterium]|nr:hypothetical protein [Clostridia bacterium]